MNKNYTKALINEMFDNKVLNSEQEREEMKQLIAENEENLTGNFDEDYGMLTDAWWEAQEQGVDEDPTIDIEEIVDSLKVGFNLVPGVGAGYCSNEEDLQNMKEFVRGALTVMKFMGI